MLNISLEVANTIYTYASIVAITAALISACGGVLTYMASSVQDRYSDQAIANANKMSAEANNAAAQANVTTEKLTKQNLELSIQLETEKKERLKIEESLRTRVLTEKEADKLIKGLESARGIASVIVAIARQEPEVINYSRQIIQTLKKAGINTLVSNTHIFSTGSNTGMHVVIFEGPGYSTVEKAIKESELSSSIRRAAPESKNSNYGFDRSKIAATITIFQKDLHL